MYVGRIGLLQTPRATPSALTSPRNHNPMDAALHRPQPLQAPPRVGRMIMVVTATHKDHTSGAGSIAGAPKCDFGGKRPPRVETRLPSAVTRTGC
jgi:hypothetical protein